METGGLWFGDLIRSHVSDDGKVLDPEVLFRTMTPGHGPEEGHTCRGVGAQTVWTVVFCAPDWMLLSVTVVM